MSQVRSNDGNTANTNRLSSFIVTAELPGTAGADIFLSLVGPNDHYKHYGKINNPTQAQVLAQLRLSLLTRVMSRYAILVGVSVGSVGSDANAGVRLEYETDRSGPFHNVLWDTDQTQDKELVADIVDVRGVGGMNFPKTKPGLQTILDELGAVSYDDSATFIFGTNATLGVTLPDGTTATGPSLAGGGASGLLIAWDNNTVIAP